MIKNGAVWYDTDGNVIQAHGGGMLYCEEQRTYYWYGEDKTEPNLPGKDCVPITGVHCYSSQDLLTWKNEGVVLPVFNNPQFVDGSAPDDAMPLYLAEDSAEYQNSPLPAFSMQKGKVPENGTQKAPHNTLIKHNSAQRIAQLNALYDGLNYQQKRDFYLDFNWNKVVERPKVVFNRSTGKYVMWWHHDGDKAGDYWVARGGVAVSDSPAGPFRYLRTMRMPNHTEGVEDQGMLRDMTVFVDGDEKAYLIYSSESNRTTVVLLLDDTYTAPAADAKGNCTEGIHWKRIHSDYREAPAVFKQDGVYYMITSGLTGWLPNRAKYHVSKNGIMGDWEDKGDPCRGFGRRTTFKSQSTFALTCRDKDGNVVPEKFILMCDRWKQLNLRDSRYVWLPINLDTKTQTLTIRYCRKI